MFESLNGVDWNLLHRQKLSLLALREQQARGSTEAEALSGVIHLLDALQDDAAAIGRWEFPEDSAVAADAQPMLAKRYYVEDDEGHHHGPIDSYEEAASVADEIDGRIITQDVDATSTSSE